MEAFPFQTLRHDLLLLGERVVPIYAHDPTSFSGQQQDTMLRCTPGKQPSTYSLGFYRTSNFSKPCRSSYWIDRILEQHV